MSARWAPPNVRGMETADTVTEAIALLEADGYRTDFSFTDGTIRCTACDVAHRPPQLLVRRTFRFEGDTDPGDEAIVLGIECPACGMRGVVVSAFGPDASPEFIELLTHLDN
jgi:hypothetical protein